MGRGAFIAVYVFSLYLFLAPVVLFGIFVFFDRLGRPAGDTGTGGTRNSDRAVKPGVPEDPAVWTVRDIIRFRGRV